MEFDATELLSRASAQSGISLERLTDAQLGELSMEGYIGDDGRLLSPAEFIERHGHTGPPPAADTYHTLQGSLGSLVRYANGAWEGGLEAVMEDCRDSRRLARFMQAVVEVLINDPKCLPDTVGLDQTRLAQVLQTMIRA